MVTQVNENLLLLTAKNGHTVIVSIFITAGANVNAINFDSIFDDKENKTTLHLAVENGHTDIVSLHISAAADLNATDLTLDIIQYLMLENSTTKYLSIEWSHKYCILTYYGWSKSKSTKQSTFSKYDTMFDVEQ
ncbi:hypothetical protein THRCLA_07575 [Thraustotheca clavata]|uniref:Uncharacterized protein n=1 Tax=Thraustotheca clavata TaxID=74557 RepID=A0A1V9ZCZ4_9STRA|nr:hypothetical protein THRCLA_07575 [Thraustotheca clavata]